jgi:hypothetical protein
LRPGFNGRAGASLQIQTDLLAIEDSTLLNAEGLAIWPVTPSLSRGRARNGESHPCRRQKLPRGRRRSPDLLRAASRPTITLRGIILHAAVQPGIAAQWCRDGGLLAAETNAVPVPKATGNYMVLLRGACPTVRSETFPVLEVPALGPGGVFPNPATVQVALALPAGVTCSSVSLLDGTGREVALPIVHAYSV